MTMEFFMRRCSISFLLVAFFLSASSVNANAADRVTEFRGSGNTTTAIFRVESPWLLDWRLDGDHGDFVALDIALIEASTGRHVGRVLHTKRKGNGVKLFESSGRYQLRISSSFALWTIKIQQITREDAELYTPK